MQAIQEALDGIRNTFDFVSGANDVIVVHHRDGSVACSAFSVQTSAHTVNRHLLGKQVEVLLNGQLTHLQMTIGQDGRCVFGDGTYVPQLHEITLLPLRDGRNSLDFRAGGNLLANAGLFSWKWSDRIVVVDIDGTITRTDSGGVLASSEFGQQLGLAHAHKGVCSTMSQIASAGYRLMFLTARPITRSEATRKYLSTIGHEETPPVMMPEGALITSAMGTLGTMANVWKDLKSYKLTQLREIEGLFRRNGGGQGVYAGGFGNHGYDADAYLEAGCPKNRVFLIDEDSHITVPGSDQVAFDGYIGLQPYVQELFPSVVVVLWQEQVGDEHRGLPLPPSDVASRRAISLNKIPGYAYLGEGLGKIGGVLASTTTSVGSTVGQGLDKLPGAQSVKKGLSGVGSVVPFPSMPQAPPEEDPPPPYDGLETQGLIDMGP